MVDDLSTLQATMDFDAFDTPMTSGFDQPQFDQFAQTGTMNPSLAMMNYDPPDIDFSNYLNSVSI